MTFTPRPLPLAEAAPLPPYAAPVDFGTVRTDGSVFVARDGSDWGRTARDALERHSPTSLKLTLAALRAARALPSLEACLDLEYRLVCRILTGHDFYEGVRAGGAREGPRAPLASRAPGSGPHRDGSGVSRPARGADRRVPVAAALR